MYIASHNILSTYLRVISLPAEDKIYMSVYQVFFTLFIMRTYQFARWSYFALSNFVIFFFYFNSTHLHSSHDFHWHIYLYRHCNVWQYFSDDFDEPIDLLVGMVRLCVKLIFMFFLINYHIPRAILWTGPELMVSTFS